MCVLLVRLTPKKHANFAIIKTASMRLAFYCNLTFMYNILLLNINLSANEKSDELDAVLTGSFIINRKLRRIGRTAYSNYPNRLNSFRR